MEEDANVSETGGHMMEPVRSLPQRQPLGHSLGSPSSRRLPRGAALGSSRSAATPSPDSAFGPFSMQRSLSASTPISGTATHASQDAPTATRLQRAGSSISSPRTVHVDRRGAVSTRSRTTAGTSGFASPRTLVTRIGSRGGPDSERFSNARGGFASSRQVTTVERPSRHRILPWSAAIKKACGIIVLSTLAHHYARHYVAHHWIQEHRADGSGTWDLLQRDDRPLTTVSSGMVLNSSHAVES
eukprot:TRINITY_DN32341_c0_g1_i1.p1 TRINITY_DN32341_c0_g1~~TRINITY_DN32341_c0_g1_i1.p1  ORF type:complete len:243 (-),score=14.05 TRINITY_DN32341_c0_g1_i1:94-822(-)